MSLAEKLIDQLVETDTTLDDGTWQVDILRALRWR